MLFGRTGSKEPPLTMPMFHILLTLADGEGHGYAISRAIERRTGGAIRLGTGSFYRLIRQMLEAGWVEEAGEQETEGLRRRYYRLSERGRAVGRSEAERLASLVELAREKAFLPRLEPGS